MRGASGSGKSTLLNLLGLLDKPTSGELVLEGIPTAQCSESARTYLRRKLIGFIFQSFNLLSTATAVENVEIPLLLYRWPARKARAQALHCLAKVGLERQSHRKPGQCSGGERQRIAIARALVKNPSVILADEPTANLDSKNSKSVMDLLRTLHTDLGVTLLVATHDSDVAGYARRVLNLRDGALLVGEVALKVG